MKNKDNSLFDYLNYILKSSDTDPKEVKVSPYLINRWITMANPVFSIIANTTINRWGMVLKDFNTKSFYRTILPKCNRNISYIKKEAEEKDIKVDDNLATIMECSQREINLFEQTLAELKLDAK